MTGPARRLSLPAAKDRGPVLSRLGLRLARVDVAGGGCSHPLPGLAAAFADEPATQVDGLDRGEGTDVGEGDTVDHDEVGVVAAA